MLQDAPHPTLPSDTDLPLPMDAPPLASDQLPRDQANSFSTEPSDERADYALPGDETDPPQPTPEASTSRYGFQH